MAGNCRQYGGGDAKNMFHITWGAGLCTRFMTAICPHAIPVGVSTIPAILTFRGYDEDRLVVDTGIELRVAVWHVEGPCEVALDQYKNSLRGLTKAYTHVTVDGTEHEAQTFMATSARTALSLILAQSSMIRRGYEEWGFPQKDLDNLMTTIDRAAA
jgi:hypothetical protein